MNSLPRMISDAMAERGLTYRAVSDNARRHGHTIGHSVVHGYATGTTKRYKRDVLEAIAAGIGMPARQLLDAANLPRDAEPFELPEDAVILTPAEREAIRGVVRTMIETRRQVMGSADSTAPMSQADVESAHREKYGLAAKEALDEPLGQDHTGSP